MPNPYPEVPCKIKKKEKRLKPLYEFYLKNEIAYTEDHIPVKKLHLFGMPVELTQDALLDYFTQNYGQNVLIERIEDSVPADEDREYLPTWSAFALFANVRDAAKVLQNSERKIHVQPCYSWLQPDSNEESNELEFATSPNILQLNDDCLECVFQYLPLADQIRMVRACTRFRTIYQRIAARHHKSVRDDVTKDLTLWETREFCQLSGLHVQSLSLLRGRSENFERCFYAGLHFPNVKKLYLHDKQLKVRKLQRILLGTNKLKELQLETRPRTDPLELAHLKELKKLDISEWNTESLSLPTSIESLTLNGWHEFNCLPSILRGHTRIKKLDVNESANVFKEMAESQAFASVEVLKIGFSTEVLANGEELIAQLPKLKKLCIHFSSVYPEVIPEIIEHYSHQLDHFEIPGLREFDKEDVLRTTSLSGLHSLVLSNLDDIDEEIISALGKLTELKRFGWFLSNITDSLVHKLLINCPKLSKLRMENCTNITVNVVHSIIKNDIQSGNNQRDLPFKLYLHDFRKSFQTSSDVVEVIFGCYLKSEWFDEELNV